MNRLILSLLVILPVVQGQLPGPDFSSGCVVVQCPDTVDPWCCNGVDEYPNECLAQCTNFGDLSQCAPGECLPTDDQSEPSDCAATCSDVVDPSCCNGVDEYANKCLAECAVGDLSQCERGSCSGGGSGSIDCRVVRCSSEFTDPLCCDGVTQPNECWAQCGAGIKDTSQCTPGFCPGDEVICTTQFAPVCCNGETFSNDCEARKQLGDDVDEICVKGDCTDVIFCPTVVDPVCCNGDQQFGNSCEASRYFEDPDAVCVPGECQTTDDGIFPPPDFSNGCAAVTCPNFVDDPQCCDGQSFDNFCLAQCTLFGDVSSCEPGFCPGDDIGCITQFDPVCCNGETFSNDCDARKQLGDDVDEICEKGDCRDLIFCPAVFDPVCCNGDQQFGNSCEAGRDLQDPDAVCVPGECPTTDGLPACPNDNVANCFRDPCQGASCPSDPNAVCLSNYCLEPFQFLGTTINGGGCDTVWVNYQNNKVVSDEECKAENDGGFNPSLPDLNDKISNILNKSSSVFDGSSIFDGFSFNFSGSQGVGGGSSFVFPDIGKNRSRGSLFDNLFP